MGEESREAQWQPQWLANSVITSVQLESGPARVDSSNDTFFKYRKLLFKELQKKKKKVFFWKDGNT